MIGTNLHFKEDSYVQGINTCLVEEHRIFKDLLLTDQVVSRKIQGGFKYEQHRSNLRE